MSTIERSLLAAAAVMMATLVYAEGSVRVRVRNDARLVQTFQGKNVVFRCEQMGGSEQISVRRWIRDCNYLTYVELQEMKREKRFAADKVPRQPLGEEPKGDTLIATLPIDTDMAATQAP